MKRSNSKTQNKEHKAKKKKTSNTLDSFFSVESPSFSSSSQSPSIVDLEVEDDDFSNKQISNKEDVVDINEDNIVPIFLTKEQKKRKALKVLQKERDELQQKDKEIFGIGNSDFFKERDKSNPYTNIISTITLQPINSKWNNNITYYYNNIDDKEIKNMKPIEINHSNQYNSIIDIIDESYWIKQRENKDQIRTIELDKENIKSSLKEYECSKYYSKSTKNNICTIPHVWYQSYQHHNNNSNIHLPNQSFLAFKSWLEEWKSFYEKERNKENEYNDNNSYNDDDDDEYMLDEMPSKIFYIYGPISTYKTVTITEIATSLEYEILTYGSDCCRSKEKLMKEVKEAIQCKSIFSMKKSKKQKSPTKNKTKNKESKKQQERLSNKNNNKCIIKNKNTKPKLILFEDCDFVSDVDNGFFSSLQSIINDTLCPIIFTSNNICEFVSRNANSVLHSYKYNDDIIYDYVKKIMKIHNVDLSEKLFYILYDYYDKDIRKLLNNFQLWMNNNNINENVLWNCILGFNPLSIDNINHLIHLTVNSFDKIERFETLTRNYYNLFNQKCNNKEIKNEKKNYEIISITPQHICCMNNETININGSNFDDKIKAILVDDYQVTDFILKDCNNIEIAIKPETLQCCRYYHINFLLSDGSLFPQYPDSYHHTFFVIHSCEDEKELIEERKEDFEDKIEEFSEDNNNNKNSEKLHIINTPFHHFNVRRKLINNNSNNNDVRELEEISKFSDILSVINTFEYDEIRDNKMKEYEEYLYSNILRENINSYVNPNLIPQYISTRTKIKSLEKVKNSYFSLNNLFTNRNEKVDYISSFRSISYIMQHNHCSYQNDLLIDYDLTNENYEFLSNKYSQFVN